MVFIFKLFKNLFIFDFSSHQREKSDRQISWQRSCFAQGLDEKESFRIVELQQDEQN
jgi:hypothetical protein